MTAATGSPLLTAPIGPTIIRLAAPNMIAMVVTMVTMMAEAWYVGQLGTEALAGLALGFPMMMLVMMLSAGSFGGTITGAVARRLGAGDRAGAEVLAFHAVLLMMLLAVACSLVLLLGGRSIYSLLGGRGPVLEQALAYSNVLFLGCVSIWLANALAAIVRATGHMQVAAKGLLAGSLLQVVAAGVLVFGLGPFPKMGIAGAAAGIVIGLALAVVLLLLYFLTTVCAELRLRFSGMPLKLAPMAALLKLAALAAVTPFCTLAAVMLITAFVARLGVDVLAGYGVGARLELLLVPMVFGCGAASTAMVGVHFGANAIARGHQAGWTAALYSAVLCGLVGGAVALYPALWANLFTDSESVRAACRAYLQIVGPVYSFGVSMCLLFASQGAGRVFWPVMASVLRVLVIALGCAVLARNPDVRAEHFFRLIAIGLAVQGLLTAAAIRLGAWTRGLGRQAAR